MGKPGNFLVRAVVRECFTQQRDVVTQFFQQITQIIGNVMIQQKLYFDGGAICLATSRSISPRWSS